MSCDSYVVRATVQYRITAQRQVLVRYVRVPECVMITVITRECIVTDGRQGNKCTGRSRRAGRDKGGRGRLSVETFDDAPNETFRRRLQLAASSVKKQVVGVAFFLFDKKSFFPWRPLALVVQFPPFSGCSPFVPDTEEAPGGI